MGIIYLPSLNRRASCLAWLLLGFAVGLSGCKQPKTEEVPTLKTEEAHPKVKAGEAEIIAISNEYVSEKGEDLTIYENPEVTEHETYWEVFYDNKENYMGRFVGDLSVIIDGQTLQPRPNDCYELKTGDLRIMEIANKYITDRKGDLSLYNVSIKQHGPGWYVSYKCKQSSSCRDLGAVISRASCRPRRVGPTR